MIQRKFKNSEYEHNTGTDRYLITYADLITLLLGLFVILYAASQVDEEKYKELSKAFTEYFTSDKPGVLQGGIGIFQGDKSSLPEPIFMGSKPKSLNEVAEQAQKALKTYIDKGDIKIKFSGNKLILILPEKLLFRSGSAEVENAGNVVLDSLARILRGIQFQVEVDGHTDTDPIKTFRYESNWHLSGARAINVAWKLIRKGVPETYISFRGFGSQRPVGDNLTEEGKAQNRRVEITISELPPTTPSDAGYSDIDSSKER